MSFPLRVSRTGVFFAAALAGLAMLVPRPADPHPHVWIDTVVKPQFQDGLLTAFAIDWTFDDLYSFLVIDDFDSNNNGTLDPDELDALAKASRDTLAATNYFTRVMLDGENLRNLRFKNLTTSSYLERISYHFVIELDGPVDLRTQELTFATYDENYYIEILLNEADPIRFEGDWPRACHYAIGRDEDNRIYFDLVAPTIVTFPCLSS